MTGDIQELQAIHMSVQTADLNMIGFKCDETITLSCGLMNIGRGICSVTIKPSSNIVPKHKGSLDIEINRPYMRAIIDLAKDIVQSFYLSYTFEQKFASKSKRRFAHKQGNK